LWLIGAAGLCADFSPADIYMQGKQAYDRGEWSIAEQHFRQLVSEPPPIGPLACFALGNISVRRATQEDLVGRSAQQLLLDAIRWYRTASDARDLDPLLRADVHHNLELAKRLRNETARRPTTGQAPFSSSQISRRDAADRGKPGPNESVDAHGPVPEKTAEPHGRVQRPRPGLPFRDPGPMHRREAETKLQDAIRRIERDYQNRRLGLRAVRPPGRGDY
jgi:hypothetical protein